MQNMTASMWPFSTATSSETMPSAPWGLGEAIETQARLWNQLLDANRGFWSFYNPWLQMGPWLWNAALAPQAQEEQPGEEPAQTVDGIPDALETQARSWNHFLDANRGFWTALGWPVPGAPWPNTGEQAEPASKSAKVIDMPAKRRTRPATTRGGKSAARRAR